MSKFSYFPKDKTKTGYGRCEPEDINMLGNELINTINSANLTPSMNETDQLAKSISNYVAKGTFCKDITTDYAHINLQIQSPFKAPNTYYDGMIITFLPININLANATVNVNGLGEKPIREKIDKEGIAVGVIAQNQYIQLIYNKSLDSFIIFQTQNQGEDKEGGNLIVGQIISVLCSSSYVPSGCLPCNGTEYNKTSFNDLWTNYLTATTPLLETCTYEEYASDMTTYGQCAKFAIDTQNHKFKVPTIKDGSYITQALSDTEIGKSYNESLPNITGTLAFEWQPQGNPGVFFQQTTKGNGEFGSGLRGNNNTGFDASRSSSAYQDGAKVQGDNVRLRFFVVVANGFINQSQMDWSAWASGLQGKANTDGSNVTFSNLSEDAKNNIITMLSPNFQAKITRSVNTDYTATQAGWIFGYLNLVPNGTFAYITVDGADIGSTAQQPDYADGYIPFFVFVPAGKTYVVHSTGDTVAQFYFCPLNY